MIFYIVDVFAEKKYSGNGCLAGYLVHHRYFGKEKIRIRTAQGYEINRPSLLFLNAEKHDDRISVSVGGRVIKVGEGELV